MPLAGEETSDTCLRLKYGYLTVRGISTSTIANQRFLIKRLLVLGIYFPARKQPAGLWR
jgi:hypothetical protein